MSEPIKIKGVVKEDVGRPRNDGTPGSGLYEVPLQLSDLPSHRWAELFAPIAPTRASMLSHRLTPSVLRLESSDTFRESAAASNASPIRPRSRRT